LELVKKHIYMQEDWSRKKDNKNVRRNRAELQFEETKRTVCANTGYTACICGNGAKVL